MLNLHSGGTLIEYDALRQLTTPAATASHVPVEHYRLVDLVRGTLAMYGHEIVEEHHAIDHDTMRYFGLMTLGAPSPATPTLSDYETATINPCPSASPSGLGSSSAATSRSSAITSFAVSTRPTPSGYCPGSSWRSWSLWPNNVRRSPLRSVGIGTAPHRPAGRPRRRHHVSERGHRRAADRRRARRVGAPASKVWGTTAWRLFNAATYALEGKVAERPRLAARPHRADLILGD